MVKTPAARPARAASPTGRKRPSRAGAAPAAPGAPLRPHGRSLGDFGELSPAEQTLLDCCRTGDLAIVARERPEAETGANRVRASFIRFLALGGDSQAPVHERGVQLVGAWVDGRLDLGAATIGHYLLLVKCRIERIEAYNGTLRALNLDGSRLTGGFEGDWLRCEGGILMRGGFHASGGVALNAATMLSLDCSGGRFDGGGDGGDALSCDGAAIAGDTFLSAGFHAAGRVRMRGATIGGTLQCDDGRFENEDGQALVLDKAAISGAVFMRGVHVLGAVRLPGARIGASLECDGGRFDNGGGDALRIEQARISGSVYLREGFHATGQVRFDGTVIEGNLECVAGRFENGGGLALGCEGARAGRLFFRSAVEGRIDLTAMRVATLCDHVGSWAQARGRLVLDGFTYERLSGDPADAAARIAWLELQLPEHLGEDFRPQPWEQLISVLRAMGHPEEARKVAIAKHRRMRGAGRYVGGSRLWDWLYGNLVGYGYRPWKLLRIVAAIWLLCALVYWPAANPGLFGLGHHLLAPARSEPDTACLAARAAAGNEEPCPPKPPRYEDLFLPAYSAEILIPVISLGGKGDWKPVVSTAEGRPLLWGWAVRFVYWFEILFGWLASLLLIAAVGNLVKKE